jgi:hypothetical protein
MLLKQGDMQKNLLGEEILKPTLGGGERERISKEELLTGGRNVVS